MKIKILKSKSNKYWYADKIGEQFVVDFINNDGNYIINNIGTVLKEDSEEVIFDSVVESVISQFRKRSEAGIKKYGVIKIKDTYKINVKDNQIADILNLKSELAKKGENIIVTVNL